MAEEGNAHSIGRHPAEVLERSHVTKGPDARGEYTVEQLERLVGQTAGLRAEDLADVGQARVSVGGERNCLERRRNARLHRRKWRFHLQDFAVLAAAHVRRCVRTRNISGWKSAAQPALFGSQVQPVSEEETQIEGQEMTQPCQSVTSREESPPRRTGRNDKRDVAIDVEKLGFLLRVYGITINDLAREMGFDRSYLSKAIHGQVRPSVKFLTRLAQAIQCFGRNRRIDSSMFLHVRDTQDDSAGSDQDEPPG